MNIRPLSEIQIQGTAWAKVWKDFKELRRCFFHVPNESTYDNSQQKSSGVIPGIQDMILLCFGRCWLIELKDDKGVISRDQKVVHSIHKVQGFDTYVFRDPDDIYNFVADIFAIGWRYNEPLTEINFNLFEEFSKRWDSFISPYSVADDYERLLDELQKYKQAQRAKKFK